MIFILFALYSALLFIIDYENLFSNIYDVFWDLRKTFFSVAFIAIFIRITSGEKEYKSKVITRHWIYCNLMFETASIIIDIMKKLNIGYQGRILFYSNLNMTRTIKEINLFKNIQLDKFTKENIFPLISNIKDLYYLLYLSRKDIYTKHWDDMWDVDYNLSNVNSSLNGIYNAISSLDVNECKKTLISFLRYNYSIVDSLRKPWRIDMDVNTKIFNILYKDNKDELGKCFYISALFNIEYTH